MTRPHTDIVRGDGGAPSLMLARVLEALCLWLEGEERGSISLSELRGIAAGAYERAGPVEERR